MVSPSFFSSFRYAISGVITALKQERNLRFHFCTAGYVLFFSGFYAFSGVEYALLSLAICGVISMELVNSAIERTVENPEPARWRTAGVVKDMAAGGVLIFSIGAATCGVCLFWQPQVLKEIVVWFWDRPIAILFFIISLLLAWLFVFYPQKIFGILKKQ